MNPTHAEQHADQHVDDGHGHIVPPLTYFIVYLILMGLMIATVLVAQRDLGAANNAVALAIAVVKAVLVVLFFMQVKYSTRLTWLWAAIGFVWLFILFATLSDYYSRQWIKIPGWQ